MLDTTNNAAALLPQQAVAQPRSAPTPSGCRRWHLVATKPKAERIAHAALHHRGYGPYLPLLLGRPLFPGYCFLQLGTDQPWYPIAWCPGVYSLLQCQGKPSIVPGGVISALQAGDELRATPIPKSSCWAPGTPCRLAAGPFAHHDAVVTEVGHDIARVALMMFGQLRTVSVNLDYLTTREE